MNKEYTEFLLQKTKEDYNLIAEDFSRTRESAWGEFNFFADYVKNGDKILDAGCGNGRLLELLNGKNIDYIGIDIAENLVKIAKGIYPQRDFFVADNLNLPFPDNNFDEVFSIAVLHTVPSKELREEVLAELKRVLKPQGKLFLTVWNLRVKNKFFLFLQQYFLKVIGKSKLDSGDLFIPWADKTKRYYHFFTERELYDLAEKVGFRIIRKGIIENKKGNRSNIYITAEKPL